MRILIVHNRYRSENPSGENDVVDDEIRMLAQAGCEVETYIPSSDEIAGYSRAEKVALAGKPFVSLRSNREIRSTLERFRPDVMHLHNPYPLISPSAIRVAKRMGVPVVQTVHNFRHVCANALLFRDNKVCEDCVGKRFGWPAVVHKCYRDSAAQSAIMVSAMAFHRPTWRLVDRFLAVSPFVAEKITAAGIPAGKIVYKPNAIEDPGPGVGTPEAFLFAGRLDDVKGPLLLLDAWERSGRGENSRLVMVGDGPLRPVVEKRTGELPGVDFRGRVDRATVSKLLREAVAMIVPSLCYEGFPRTVVEAFAHGRPVVGTNVGSLGRVVDDEVGWLADATSEALGRVLSAVTADGAERRGQAARSRYDRLYSEAAVTRQMLAIYEEVSRKEKTACAL